jgi:hypothetical protein
MKERRKAFLIKNTDSQAVSRSNEPTIGSREPWNLHLSKIPR